MINQYIISSLHSSQYHEQVDSCVVIPSHGINGDGDDIVYCTGDGLWLYTVDGENRKLCDGSVCDSMMNSLHSYIK